MLAIDSWLWGIEHSHLRVYLALAVLSASEPMRVRDGLFGDVDVPVGGVVTSLDRLSKDARVSREVVRGALKTLAAGPGRDGADPAITISRAARSYTLIIVNHTRANTTDNTARNIATGGGGAIDPNTLTTQTPAPQHSNQHGSQHSNQHAPSIAIPTGNTPVNTVPPTEITSSRIDLPASSAVGQHGEQHTTPSTSAKIGAGTPPALRSDPDPDSRSDLGKDHDHRDVAEIGATVPPLVLTPQGSDETEPDPEEDTPPESLSADERAKTATRASKVPEQCWKAADYLRSKILEEDPQHVLGRRAWKADQRTGLRLKWAEEFRLMKDRDGRTLTEAKTLIDWLFGGQTQDMGFRFVVQSPDALRRKWQNILIRRREQSQPRIAPAKPSTVMPRNSKPL